MDPSIQILLIVGGEGETYDLNDCPSDMIDIMKEAHNNCAMMCCDIAPEPGSWWQIREDGLVARQTFAVTKVVSVEDEAGENHDLVRVQNPWGNSIEWKGAWADGSDEWQNISEVIQKVGGFLVENLGVHNF